MVGSSSSPQKGGLYRNLMMPGFTDAGAVTAYIPQDVIRRRTAATSSRQTKASVVASSNANDNNNHDVNAASQAEDTFSEAGTELHDNRTNKSSMANRDRYYLLKTDIVKESDKSEKGHEGRSSSNTTVPNKNSNSSTAHNNNNDHANNTSNDSIEVEPTFGFFPSTKPPPSPSPRGNAGTLVASENRIDGTEKSTKTPKRGTKHQTTPLSPSPQPLSPPPVARKQMVATKRAEIGDEKTQKSPGVATKTTTMNSPKSEKSQNDQGEGPADQHGEGEAKMQQETFPLHERSFAIQRGMMKREVSTFSLAPEIGAVVEKGENRAKLNQGKQKEALNQKREEENETELGGGDLPNDETCSNFNDGNTTRRLDLSALQEIDRMEGEKQTKGNEELSTSSSIVSSTCSEFGTVIQLGESAMAARLKEVEEMELAALAEVPSEDNGTEEKMKAAPILSSASLLHDDKSLDPPISDLSLSGKNDVANNSKCDKVVESLQSDTKTNIASANSTICPMKRNPTKSQMVSAAFRRIGPIHNLNNNNNNNVRGDKKVRNSVSAPTTPMRLYPSNHSKQPPGIPVEGPEASPSCYETASDVAGDKKTQILSPRFTAFLRGRGNGDTTSSSIAKQKTTFKEKAASQLSPRVAITQTFQYAQKCFANDNTLIEYGTNSYDHDVDLYDIEERRRKLQEDLIIPPLGERPTTARLAPRVMPLESSSLVRNRRRVCNFSRGLRPSQSLDYSSSIRSPFRELPSSTSQQYPFLHHSFPAPPKDDTTDMSTSANIDLRSRIDSDFSLTKISTKTTSLNSTMELHQPQRIEIEREDALDILACLVEQGIDDWNTSTQIQNIDPASINRHNDDHQKKVEKHLDSSSDIMKITKEMKSEEDLCPTPPASEEKLDLNGIKNCDHSESDLYQLIGDFKKWIEKQDEDSNSNSENGTSMQHQRQHRTEILQELVKSHAYAVEMKRASVSASTWLKSIGRGQGMSDLEILESREEKEQQSLKISADVYKVKNRETDEKNASDKIDTLTLKATLHSAQLELTETKQQNSRLNEELSKCRAEIGRIKSISRSDRVNKSILDDSSEKSLSETRSKEYLTEDDQRNGTSKTDPVYESFFQGVPSNEARERVNSTGELDLVVLKSAMDKANDTIRRLYYNLNERDGLDDEGETDQAPVVDFPEVLVNKLKLRSPDSNSDSTLLDGENFITSWDALKTLPPPPDHSLQSPIVSAVLEQWTQDRSLHESLLSWMDNVMKGDDLEDLPPLTISSLDHQVRDGFTMHVLPHLLRRADIHVAVKTRSHRQTTYDMSVTVSQKKEGVTISSTASPSAVGYFQPHDMKSQQQLSLLDRRDSMSGDEWVNRFEPKISSAESVAHSAVTEAITNHSSTKQSDPWDQPPQTPRQAEYSEFSSRLRSRSGSAGSFDEGSQHYGQQQSEQNQGAASGGTIMGALGGALSGLLSRNKYVVSPGRSHASQTRFLATGSAEDSRNSPNMLTAGLRAQMDLTSSPTPGSNVYHRVGQLEANLPAAIDSQRQHYQEEPYHRVVSAPPGRIGLTFVEFRGHAMVSDIATDSPLAGWVFPSDILIAVDEIPVSGMRVRDIVTILSDRKNRQRAMRVMSSHDMNEFTMMSQVGGPSNEENGEDE